MILVDTSVWINLLSAKPTLTAPVEQLPMLATCPPVIQEVLQGIGDAHAYAVAKDAFLALTCLTPLVPLDCYLRAAELYRHGRRKGITIRSSVDCLIAAIAIKHHASVWHQDRDFDAIADFCELQVVRRI